MSDLWFGVLDPPNLGFAVVQETLPLTYLTALRLSVQSVQIINEQKVRNEARVYKVYKLCEAASLVQTSRGAIPHRRG